MNQNQLELSTLARHFEVHNRSEGKSLRTVEWYNEVLALFHDWLEGEGLPTSLDRIWEEEVRAFVLYLPEICLLRPGGGDKTTTTTYNERPLSIQPIPTRIRGAVQT